MKRLSALFAMLLLLPLSACAGGQTLVDVQVIDLDQGESLLPVGHRGRDWIAGRPGHRFAVAMHNLSGERVLAVLSVDGVNAISGQTAGTAQAGYVLEPWQRVEIRGWRKSHADIAEFYFTDLPDSYAARTGRPDNVGVIGVAAFREHRPQPIPYYPPSSPMIGGAEKSLGRTDPPSANAADAQAAREQSYGPSPMPQQIGTGHGERRYDPVAQTTFQRESARPNQRVALYYDSLEALVARGIIRDNPRREAPEPFPIGFVPDPR